MKIPARQRRNRAGRIHLSRRDSAEGPYGDQAGAITTSRRLFRYSPSSASPCGAADLPLHLHRQAAGRAGDTRRGANEVFVPLLQKQFTEISISTCRLKAALTAWPW